MLYQARSLIMTHPIALSMAFLLNWSVCPPMYPFLISFSSDMKQNGCAEQTMCRHVTDVRLAEHETEPLGS